MISLISLNDIFKKELFFGNFSNLSFNLESFPRFNIKRINKFYNRKTIIGWGSASFPYYLFQENLNGTGILIISSLNWQ